MVRGASECQVGQETSGHVLCQNLPGKGSLHLLQSGDRICSSLERRCPPCRKWPLCPHVPSLITLPSQLCPFLPSAGPSERQLPLSQGNVNGLLSFPTMPSSLFWALKAEFMDSWSSARLLSSLTLCWGQGLAGPSFRTCDKGCSCPRQCS